MRFLVVLAFASVAFAGLNFVSTSEIGAPVEDKVDDDYVLELEEDDDDDEGYVDINDILDSKSNNFQIVYYPLGFSIKEMHILRSKRLYCILARASYNAQIDCTNALRLAKV